ncbi:SDR family NAD(P)-dependent oxidoreductase [Anabaena azotica]|uniref:SDR family oxidoreductase n=1 Tax=Anabaena azotica FACHB-119 TaxID=947527 RepID=A0ABR8D538_9NOST|nr:SDR family oxidoreductase [Anabaena azotica]MBD2501410.1 SDR family oxidoreductase [Anabaena azotica FACHB-119]
MDLKLQGKTALVSGSTAGIGLAIAQALAQEGASVIINGRTEQRVAEAIAKIKSSNSQAQVTGVVADGASKAGIEQMLQQVPDVDILINNLGIYEPKAFFEITDEDWLHIFETNVLSGVRLSRYYLQKMLERNWGRIIFIENLG